jgi:uncharacterized cupin superfamily protein
VTEINLFSLALTRDDEDPDGYHASSARVAPLVGGSMLGLTVYELPPGQSICPYHWETDEEWLIVLAGRPTLRTPEGEHELVAWDTVCFPVGPDGAHKVTNRGDELVRVGMLSTRKDPGIAVYPDSNKIGAWPPGKLFRLDDAVDYWVGEVPGSDPGLTP